MRNINIYTFGLSTEDQSKAIQLAEELKAIYANQLAALTKLQRKSLPKMGEGTINFVSKAAEHSRANPEFNPQFLGSFASQWAGLDQLSTALRSLGNLVQQLKDSEMLLGSAAYKSALSYYKVIQGAAQNNVPGAKLIMEDLALRFAKTRNSSSGDEDETPAEEDETK